MPKDNVGIQPKTVPLNAGHAAPSVDAINPAHEMAHTLPGKSANPWRNKIGAGLQAMGNAFSAGDGMEEDDDFKPMFSMAERYKRRLRPYDPTDVYFGHRPYM